jgi:hypothetical protein
VLNRLKIFALSVMGRLKRLVFLIAQIGFVLLEVSIVRRIAAGNIRTHAFQQAKHD